MSLYTHTARKPLVGYVRRGKLFNHRDAQPGTTHAANVVGPLRLRSLCGQVIDLNGDLDPIDLDATPAKYHEPAGQAKVRCKRCLLAIARASQGSTP